MSKGVTFAFALVALMPGLAGAKDKPRKVDPEALRVMHDFGRCIGTSRTNARLLATLPYSPEEQKMAGRIANADCLRQGGELRFRAPLLRGLVAEQLFLANFATDRPRPFAEPVFVDPGPTPPGGFNGPPQIAVTMIRFGQCVASINKAGVVALLKTEATSQRERDAFSTLQPAFGQCVEPGATFHLNPFTLRGFIAEGAYRQAMKEAQKPNA